MRYFMEWDLYEEPLLPMAITLVQGEHLKIKLGWWSYGFMQKISVLTTISWEKFWEKNENSQKQQISEICSHFCWHLTRLICFAFPDAWYVTLLWCQISKQWIALGTSWCSGYPYRITSFKTSWVQTLQRLLEVLCQRLAVMETFDNDPGLKLYAFNPLNHGGNKKVTHI